MEALGKVIGRRIKSVRERAGISKSELAAKIGVVPSLVSLYESGCRKPSVDVLLQISRELGCSTDFLFGAASDSMFIDDDVVSIFADFKGLSPRDKALIKEMISIMRQIS